MPDPSGQNSPAGDGAAAAGKGNTGGTGTDTHLEAICKQLEGVQTLIGRFGNDLGNLRKKVEATAARPGVQNRFDSVVIDDEADPVQAEIASVREELETERRERGLDRFARTFGGNAADWKAITERLAANETQYHVYARDQRTGQARLDYQASYEKVWSDIQLERFRAAQAAAGQQRTEQDEQRRTLAAQAGVSGAGATGTEAGETLDIAKMSSAEYFEKVLKPTGLYDANDPPNTAAYNG